MADRLLKVLAYNNKIRITLASTTQLVESARIIHDAWPTATAAFGRVLTGTVLAACLGNEEDEFTLQIIGSGPLGRILAIADGKGAVRGMITEPHVDLPLNVKGKFDVSKAVGLPGQIMVLKELAELKQPYQGMTLLKSGEIGEDLAAYFLQSEQIPTAVGLGVKIAPQGEIITAGGFIIQALPGVSGPDLKQLDTVVSSLPGITDELEATASLEDFLDKIIGRGNWRKLIEYEPVYRCHCTREKFIKALITLGQEDLMDLLREEEIETVCRFCLKRHSFNKEEILRWFADERC